MPGHVMNYIECELPLDGTLLEWQRARAVSTRRRRWSLRDLLPQRRVPTPAL
jgi:hypothetical protein